MIIKQTTLAEIKLGGVLRSTSVPHSIAVGGANVFLIWFAKKKKKEGHNGGASVSLYGRADQTRSRSPRVSGPVLRKANNNQRKVS